MFGFLAMSGPWGLAIATVFATAFVVRVVVREHFTFKREALHDQTLLALARLGSVGETDPNDWVAAVNQSSTSSQRRGPSRGNQNGALPAPGHSLRSVETGSSDVAQ